MTTDMGSASNAATAESANGLPDGTAGGLGQTARQVADNVASAIPEAAASTRDPLNEANRVVRSGSDSTLRVAAAIAIGFSLGLLVGGANRLLVILSLLPVALIGTTLAERMNRTDTFSSMQER